MSAPLFLLVALVLVGLTRLGPSWRWPVIGSDAGVHLLMRREIRGHGFRAPERMEPFFFDRRTSYPWLFHQFLALFPESWLRRLPALPTTLIDGLHTAIVFGVSFALIRRFFPGADPARGGFMAALLYGLNPLLLARGFGPRTYEITPRPFGELLFTLFLGAGLMAVNARSGSWAAVSVFSGAGMLLSSKFAAQVMVFFIPVVALGSGAALLWVLPVAALLAALLLSGGRYRHVVRGQLRHLKFYRARLQYIYTGVADRNRWTDFLEAWRGCRECGFSPRAFFRAVRRCSEKNTYIQMAFRGVIFLLLAIAMMECRRRGALVRMAPFAQGIWAWAWAWVVPFLVTSWKHARFLGEAERYAEYSLAPTALLMGLHLAVNPISRPIGGLLVLCAVLSVFFLVSAMQSMAKTYSDGRREQRELLTFLAGLPPGSVLLGIPEHLVLGSLASLLPHRYAEFMTDAERFVVHLEHHCEGYPWPKPDWAFWREAGVQYLVTWPPAVIAAHRPSLDYGLVKLDRLFANDRYHVYKLGGVE